MQQLKEALEPKRQQDPNKTLLRALITAQNKDTAPVGANTLKQDLLDKIMGENPEGEKRMADWLALLNKQEEGESLLTYNRTGFDGRGPYRGKGN